jgi:hypothetical protein
MSLSTHTLKRLPTIKEGLLRGLNRDQIADICKVTHKTIDRDMHAWVQSELFEVWIKEEFITTYPEIKREEKLEAFREISKLVGRMLTRKAEIKNIEEIREIKLLWIKNESNSSDQVSTS